MTKNGSDVEVAVDSGSDVKLFEELDFKARAQQAFNAAAERHTLRSCLSGEEDVWDRARKCLCSAVESGTFMDAFPSDSELDFKARAQQAFHAAAEQNTLCSSLRGDEDVWDRARKCLSSAVEAGTFKESLSSDSEDSGASAVVASAEGSDTDSDCSCPDWMADTVNAFEGEISLSSSSSASGGEREVLQHAEVSPRGEASSSSSSGKNWSIQDVIATEDEAQPDLLDRVGEKILQTAESFADVVAAKSDVLTGRIERGIEFIAARSEAADMVATGYVQQGEDFVAERSKDVSESVDSTVTWVNSKTEEFGKSEFAKSVKAKTDGPLKSMESANARAEAACAATRDMAETTLENHWGKVESMAETTFEKAEAVFTGVAEKARKKFSFVAERAETARNATWSTTHSLLKGTVAGAKVPLARTYGRGSA